MRRIHISDALRRAVVERARGQCEYCLIHQDDTPFTHQIDHVIPLKHHGQTVSDNLALACIECNRHKGSDIAALDSTTSELTPLFNPHSQSWAEHFELDEARIIGRTSIGRATVGLLRLNDATRIMQRQALILAKRYPP